MTSNTTHHEAPQAPRPSTHPGDSRTVAMNPADATAGAGSTPAGAPAHSPKRDGDNSGGESTASERRSSDKGHQRTPRPGAEEHQGGH